MYEASPAVERVEEAARAAGGERATLAHWLTALLDDDMGRPAALLERAGVDLQIVTAAAGASDAPPAPDSTRLFATARDLGVRLKADPSLTTDLVFVAVLLADSDYTARLGMAVEPLVALLRTAETDTGAAFSGGGSELVIADPPEHLAAARIVDVNLNRAREALRVLDDYARFVLDDRGLTEQVRNCGTPSSKRRPDCRTACCSPPATRQTTWAPPSAPPASTPAPRRPRWRR